MRAFSANVFGKSFSSELGEDWALSGCDMVEGNEFEVEEEEKGLHFGFGEVEKGLEPFTDFSDRFVPNILWPRFGTSRARTPLLSDEASSLIDFVGSRLMFEALTARIVLILPAFLRHAFLRHPKI